MSSAAFLGGFGQPTADWQQIKDKTYSKRALYHLGWGVDLQRSLVCAAPFGGPIAVTRDPSQILLLAHRDEAVPRMTFYTAAGVEMASFAWDRGRALSMGWLPDERLVCVFESGAVVAFGVHGDVAWKFAMPKEIVDQGLLECKHWDAGFVLLTKKLALYSFTSLDQDPPKVDALPTPKLDRPPSSWCVLRPGPDESPRNVRVLLSVHTGTVMRVSLEREQDMLVHTGPFVAMVVAPSGNLLTCFNEHGYLFVVKPDFSATPLEQNTKRRAPDALAWCGNNSVLVYWKSDNDKKENGLYMVGPSDQPIPYMYDEPVVLVTEVDGARVITNSSSEFIQRVPSVVVDVFSVGSLKPSASLYDATDMFRKQNPRADSLLVEVRPRLTDAVRDCIDAASYELNPRVQQRLLEAASFGKNFVDDYSPQPFVNMTRLLRVLNALRDPDVGIPMTYLQFTQCTPESLIGRLLERHKHLLAFRISEFLGLSTHRVVIHWACLKVASRQADDASIYEAIAARISGIQGISTAEIASAAFRARRFDLATRLLMHEPRASEQVPLLLLMGQLDLALGKAVESCDSDLVFLVIFHLRRNLPKEEFVAKLVAKPEALALFVSYCRQVDVAFLKELYALIGRAEDAVALSLTESFLIPSADVRVKAVQMSLNVYNDEARRDARFAFHADMAKNQMKLLLAQKQLEANHKMSFVGLSLSDTVSLCVRIKDQRAANSLRADFKIPDRRFWWLKLRALVVSKDWVGLEEFASSKSPIGYRPFADLLIDASMFALAAGYVQRLSDPVEKSQLFMRMNMWKEAADTAAQARNRDLLEQIRAKVQSPEGAQYIDRLMKS